MKYRVTLKERAEKQLNKLSKKDYYRIIEAFAQLANNPFVGKKLDGELDGNYSYRVWPYRIIYRIYKKELVIIILAVGHRQGVYK